LGSGIFLYAPSEVFDVPVHADRLADEGTCFSTISHNVRYGVATRHLKESEVSIEQIAAIAGFSDPANFRRAFISWTSMSPAEFRRFQHR